MKNIFSKTTEKRTQNGVKSYLSPTFVLYTISIFAFLILGVGQAWAYEFKNPKIYFNNADLKWENAMLLVGHGSWSCGYDQTTNPISNTKLVYFAPSANWGDQDGFTVCKASGWDCRGDAFTTRAGYATHIGLQYSYNFGSGNTYYVTGTIGNSPTIRVDYISGGYGAIPKYNATQGAKWRDAGTSYSITTGTWPATLNLQGTYLSGDGKSTQSTITSTASTDEDAKKVYGAVVTGEITHSYESLNSSYYFEGWGTGDTPSSTDATHTYNISENTTTYAFFSKTYTLTYDRKGTVGNSTLSVDVSNFSGTKESGSAIPTGHQVTFTASPADGYVIEGWYSDAECTKSLDNGQNTKYTISSLDADKSVYVKFEQLKTITIKFAHEATAGWTIQGVRRYPESGGQSISANGTWVTIEFTNVYAVSNIDLAYQGGDWDYLNTATKITGDCCYNRDGSPNANCCVSAPNLTWTTAPADGKVGNNMTAAVNTTPVSGGSPSVTWSTSNSNIADVNESTGVISYKAAGSATITARVTWSATGDYCAGSSDLAQTITVSAPSQEPVLGAVTATPSGQPNYARPPIDFELSVTSTYLAHPVVVFLVNDGTTTYEVVGAPYGAEGNSAAGTIGADAAYTTVHKATFTATETKTYTVSAKLYEGLLVENFETADYTTWVTVEGGSSNIVSNDFVSENNGSPKVRMITPNGVDWRTYLTRSTDKWVNGYQYIHTKMYYTAGGELRFKISDAPVVELAVAHGTNNQWNKVVFNNSGKANINFMFPWIVSNTSTFYIDDIILSNEASMTMLAETAPASFSIKSEITRITFSPGNIVAPSATVSVTATVELTPVEQTTICWRVLYSNDNPLDPQPTFTPANQGNSVSFIAPEASGSYKVEATLRKGTGCGGEEIHTFTAPFQVAGDHTVTVQYKCGNTTIKAPTSVAGKPLDWTEITAPEIVGYSFLKWVEGDGITIEGATNGEKADATINFKAIYDGKLTAIYSKKNMIYFNNTLGWSDVYVYFYNSNEYWSDTYGSGAQQTQAFNGDHKPYWEQEHGKMTRIEGTNIWYFDYTAVGYTTRLNVVFTERDQHGNQWFHQTNVVRRGDHKSSLPMFVPLAGQTPVTRNTSAEYYNEGYWMNYPENTGYSLHIYKGTTKGERDEIRSIAFPFTADKTMPMEVTLELNANTTYGYEIHRADGAYYANNSSTIKINASSDIKLSDTQRGGIKTSAAGDYVFKLNFGNSSGYGYLFSVQYPASEGSYRLVYKDLAEWSQGSAHTDAWSHPSRVIYKNEGAADTVSFFIAKGHTPTIQIQRIKSIDNEGNITWENIGSATSYDTVSAAGVYNFITSQTASALSIDKVEPYTGNYYIRTDNAGTTKWDNYRAADHQMTYSEFSKDRATNTFGELYTHYYMHWCPRGTNVKFCIANDYSSCITDTLENDLVDLHNMVKAGWLNSDGANPDYRDKFSANIRFMYDERTNKISRAYMSSSTNTDRKFLVLKSNTEFWNSDGSALNGSGESAVEGNYEAIFKDNEDWIYEREIKLTPGQKFKLYASYAQATAQENGSQHFCGNYADNDWENAENYVALVGGSSAPCNVRIIYDFKTNRLLAAMVPSGEISTEMDIYADVMFIREHQGDIEQLIFNGKGKITNIKTAYAVMRFNKWTLNNKEKTGSHNPLASPASIYERAMYFISFPFEVKLSEVFGFGTYGQDWIIEYYDGAERARTGWWEGQPGFWRYVWDRKNFVLKPNVGYLLELELGNFKEGSGFWNNKNERLELFFPSSGPLESITNASVTQTLPAHKCDINRAATEGLPDTPDPSTSYNRTVFDSHWNIMSVPTYVNVDDPSFANTTWIGGEKGNVGPKFLYTWNMNDNTLTATSGKGFMYHAMHAYTVQYYGNVTWKTSVTPPAAPQRNTEYRGEYEFCLEVQQDDQMIDRTYVRLSDDENVTTGFEFSEDMTKQFNSRKANIFTIAGNTSLGGNSLPLSTTQTTVVPVGVKIKSAGDYTFSIPEGTDGIGVTLVDNETGVRTLLSALDYTVNLTAGTHDGRFVLEISPIYNTPTGIEEPTSDSSLKGRAQKRIIDGVLYIVKDGKIFDARGTRVE